MDIERKASGFLESHDDVDGVPSVGVESDRLDDCIDYYQRKGFRGLFGHPEFGFREKNLDFLKRTRNATWLWFWDVSLNQIDALYELKDLEYVGINPQRPGIDFSRFPRLRTAVNHWLKQDTGIAESAITRYDLWHFNPKSRSFADVQIPRRVKELYLYWANPAALDGLPVLKRLQMLQIHRCRNIRDLSALPRIAPNLRRLLVTTSSRIDPSAGIIDHPTLKSALIDGRELVA